MSRLVLRHGRRGLAASLTVLPLTPMIDIALVLTVLLIATARRGSQHGTLPVSLPAAPTANSPVTGLDISIGADGSVRVRGRDIKVEDLRQLAAGLGVATIHADGAVEHRRVVAVVDVLRSAGVAKVYYAAVDGVVEW